MMILQEQKMNYKYIVSLISNKSIIAILSLMIVVSYLAYQKGLHMDSFQRKSFA